MGRKKNHWTRKIDAVTLDRIDHAIRGGGESAEALYVRFNLQRLVRPRTFREYVAELRGRSETGGGAGGSSGGITGGTPVPQVPQVPQGPQAPYVQSLLASALATLQEQLDSRTLPGSVLPATLRAITDLSRLAIDEAAEKRAAEMHELKLAELRRKQEAALDEAGPALGLSPEKLAEIKSRVLGI